MAREVPKAVMEHCPKCHRETKWEPDNYGEMHCTGCREASVRSGRRWEGGVMIALVAFIAIAIAVGLKLAR